MKVSIITVTYNSALTLEDTIRSIEMQDYPDIEYLIIDGNSNDRTKEVIIAHEGTVSHWISEPDKGLYDAMNKGIRMATVNIVRTINSVNFYYCQM